MTRRAAAAPPAGFRAGACTSAGNRRSVNEDAVLVGPTWFVVADGMGGHAAGDVASTLAVGWFAGADRAPPRTVADVRAAVAGVNDAIRRCARAVRTAGMGTTLVGAVAVAESGRPAVAVFHVGDARCYRLHAGRLTLLTRDHTHVQELIDAGRLEASAADRHPLRNVVTRALGPDAVVEPDVTVIAEPIGRLLLCSDGLWGELDVGRIGRALAGFTDPQMCADQLVEMALAGEARDNVSALVVDLAGAGGARREERA